MDVVPACEESSSSPCVLQDSSQSSSDFIQTNSLQIEEQATSNDLNLNVKYEEELTVTNESEDKFNLLEDIKLEHPLIVIAPTGEVSGYGENLVDTVTSLFDDSQASVIEFPHKCDACRLSFDSCEELDRHQRDLHKENGEKKLKNISYAAVAPDAESDGGMKGPVRRSFNVLKLVSSPEVSYDERTNRPFSCEELDKNQQDTHEENGEKKLKNISNAAVAPDGVSDSGMKGPVRRSFNVLKLVSSPEVSYDERTKRPFSCEELDRNQRDTHEENGEKKLKNISNAAVAPEGESDSGMKGPVRRSFNVLKLVSSPDVTSDEQTKRPLRSVRKESIGANVKVDTRLRPAYQSSHFNNLKKFRAAKEFSVKLSSRTSDVRNKRGQLFPRTALLGKQRKRQAHVTAAPRLQEVVRKIPLVGRSITSVPKMLILCEVCRVEFPRVSAFKKHNCLAAISSVITSQTSRKRNKFGGDGKKAKKINFDKGDDDVKYSLEKDRVKVKSGFKCDHCPIWVDRYSRYINHKKRCHGSKPYICNVTKECRVAFSYSMSRDRHIRRKHSVEESLCCEKEEAETMPDTDLEENYTESSIGKALEKEWKRPVGRGRPRKQQNGSRYRLSTDGTENRRSVGRPRKEPSAFIEQVNDTEVRRPVGRPRKGQSLGQVTSFDPVAVAPVRSTQDTTENPASVRSTEDTTGNPASERSTEDTTGNPALACPKCGKHFSHGGALHLHVSRSKDCTRINTSASLLAVVKVEENISPKSVVDETSDKVQDNSERITRRHSSRNTLNVLEPTTLAESIEDDKRPLRRLRKEFEENDGCVEPSPNKDTSGQPPVQSPRVSRPKRLSASNERLGASSDFYYDTSDDVWASEQKPYECKICLKSFVQSGTLHRHLRNVHHQKNNRRKSAPIGSLTVEDVKDVEELIECEQCGMRFTKLNSLVRHRRQSCSTAPSTDLTSVHKDEKPFVCKKCGKCCSRAASLYLHQIKSKACRISTNTADLLAVAKNENKYKPWKCNACGIEFAQACSLYRHRSQSETCRLAKTSTPLQRRSERGKSCECDVCGMQFVQSSSLYRHRKRQNCGINSKKASGLSSSAPVVEGVVDEPEFVYQCEVCSAKFSTIELFGKHECVSADSSYKAPASPEQNSTTRADSERFMCPTCCETFTNPEALKLHTDTICTLAKKYACTQCTMSFVQFNSLKAHLLLHTDDVGERSRKRVRDGGWARGQVNKGDPMLLKDYGQLVRSLEESMSASASDEMSPEKNSSPSSTSTGRAQTRTACLKNIKNESSEV